MTQWLLAAEADKIQDFVFRSSRLVQVVGGSGLLTRFCKEALSPILQYHCADSPTVEVETIIADGGSFLLRFDDKDSGAAASGDGLGKRLAEAVGRDLAEAYYRVTDSSLTVATPQPYAEGGFAQASKDANRDLRTQKADQRDRAAAVAQLPYTAVCASCGISLADIYARRHADDRPNYLCAACRRKALERDLLNYQPERERFLRHFLNALQAPRLLADLPETLQQKIGKGDVRRFLEALPSDAEQVGAYDPRRYVGYIVADGNNMGVLFSQCRTPERVKQLSGLLTQTFWDALAEATVNLVRQLWREDSGKVPIPVTPLIVGGDDLFALVPAPYALDVARHICLRFEKTMTDVIKRWEFDVPPPTMSAAVVICKQNYPYTLAHRQGDMLLDNAKRLSRTARLQSRNAINLSAVDFMLVRGSDVDASAAAEGRKHIVPTLRPYWVTDKTLPVGAEAYGVSLDVLLKARWELKALPGKRRAELKNLFMQDLPEEPRERKQVLEELLTDWRPRLSNLQGRIARRDKDAKALQDVLNWLGDNNLKATYHPWSKFEKRPHEPMMHGLPDLLEMWHFAQDFIHDLDEYGG